MARTPNKYQANGPVFHDNNKRGVPDYAPSVSYHFGVGPAELVILALAASVGVATFPTYVEERNIEICPSTHKLAVVGTVLPLTYSD